MKMIKKIAAAVMECGGDDCSLLCDEDDGGECSTDIMEGVTL
jgi:hypothetical protein